MNSAFKVRYIERTIGAAMLSDGVRAKLRTALLEDNTLYGKNPQTTPNAIGDMLVQLESRECQKMRASAVDITLNAERRLSNYRQYAVGVGAISSIATAVSEAVSTNTLAIACTALLCAVMYGIDRFLRSTITSARNLQNALIFSAPTQQAEGPESPAA